RVDAPRVGVAGLLHQRTDPDGGEAPHELAAAAAAGDRGLLVAERALEVVAGLDRLHLAALGERARLLHLVVVEVARLVARAGAAMGSIWSLLVGAAFGVTLE